MAATDYDRRVDRFFALHDDYFILPTIWDPFSALAAQAAGFGAVATSSAALGYANGFLASERMPFDLVRRQLKAIADEVDIPVSVDMEDGYPEATGDIADSIAAIIEAGVVAANIEDSPGSHAAPLVDADVHARAIARARQGADRTGRRFFINGRTDVFMLDNPPADRLDEAIRRANLYLGAGADGVYVPSRNPDDATVAALAAGINGPLTLLVPDGRPFAHWRELGVKRVSLGTSVIRSAFGAIQAHLKAAGEQGANTSPAVSIDAVLRANRALRSGLAA